MSTQGIFLDVVGLSYRCGTTQGTITSDYAYRYEIGHAVTFSIGALVLGGSISKPLMTISDLLPENTPISDPRLTNRARLLYSLSPAQGFEEPIIINTKVQNVIAKYASQVDLDARSESNLDDVLSKICGELKLSPKSVSHTRNHLRREAAGFKVMRDIQIPVRDGNFVLGDVYLPIGHGKRYPVLLSCTIYGRRVICSSPNLEDEKDIAAFEKVEDDWHSTPAGVDIQVPDDRIWTGDWIRQRGFENIATFNTFRYVPHGYAMVKIDPRGVSQTPGTRGVPGQLAADFFDAVEWAAEQSWSDGSSALVGSSYGANVQWSVAQMRPKGLKCFVPFASDIDLYREAAYPGGIPNHRFLTDWNDRMKRASPKWNDQVDLLKLMNAKPFDDDLWRGLSTQPGEISLPCFLSASQLFIIHGRGAYEAFRAMASEHVHLQVVDRDYYPWASNESSAKILQFLDRHLRGVDYVKLERVGIQMRLGNREWYWRMEKNWPVPGTRYTKWYLRSDGSLSMSPESGPAKRFEYSTKTPPSGRKCGISFQSLLFEEDVEFAGHFTATLSVSSSMPDADVVVTLWVVDEQGNAIPFSAKGEAEPLAKGFLRASHRKTDPSKSLPERPWHTHTRDDYAPLETDEVVLIEVEILPAAGRIRKGWRLRLDITPTEAQPDIPGYNPLPMRVFYGEEHAEGTNAVHLGRDRIGYITCPVVPCKQGYSNVL
ncbi:alpha/beta-hydrolase [Hyaloscypha variabilis F]|uniref:Alpha/beta-hydrolase n=1 Tax=Hyaloscypha variabilis (strain UAMH 11265 / GT02V1 / F) TaxID=1149755 RepID=A0A2J6QWK5_HYAVF|nr:alpha/beta-hydrolase [Hyaloscypha variabilis F]